MLGSINALSRTYLWFTSRRNFRLRLSNVSFTRFLFRLHSGPYEHEEKSGPDSPVSSVLEAYEISCSEYWFKKRVSPVRDLTSEYH